MPDELPWQQVNVAFPRWDSAEDIAAAHVAQRLDDRAPGCWWFMRKHPNWRFRFQAAPAAAGGISGHLDQLRAADLITGWTAVRYEPEVHAFGGPQAMAVTHRLFCADSRAWLSYLREQPGGRHRRELSLLLCSVMMRAAGLDWYEQGDVWARVAEHRKPPPGAARGGADTLAAVRRLITADSQMREGAQLARHAQRAAAWAQAGRHLAGLAANGRLHRGLRDVLAHQVIFGWNRAGLTYNTQSLLAASAQTAVFGADPATATIR